MGPVKALTPAQVDGDLPKCSVHWEGPCLWTFNFEDIQYGFLILLVNFPQYFSSSCSSTLAWTPPSIWLAGTPSIFLLYLKKKKKVLSNKSLRSSGVQQKKPFVSGQKLLQKISPHYLPGNLSFKYSSSTEKIPNDSKKRNGSFRRHANGITVFS